MLEVEEEGGVVDVDEEAPLKHPKEPAAALLQRLVEAEGLSEAKLALQALLVSWYHCSSLLIKPLNPLSKGGATAKAIGINRTEFGSGGRVIKVVMNSFRASVPESMIYQYSGTFARPQWLGNSACDPSKWALTSPVLETLLPF